MIAMQACASRLASVMRQRAMRRSSTGLIPTWPWQKAAPKRSLAALGQAANARASILTLVQAAHWLLLPVMVLVGWIIFSASSQLAMRLGSRWQVFALLLSLAFTALGGLCPMLMHAREGWQLAPPAEQVEEGNDPVLRIHAYRFLFSGLTAANLCVAVAVFGRAAPALLLVLPAALVVLLGPGRPLLPWRHAGGLLLPVPIPLALAFLLSSLLKAAALLALFGPALSAIGLPPLLALAPLLASGLGGGLEGGLAETRFNQWWHLLAILLLDSSALLEGLLLRLITT